jgi:hypothetical protein
MHSGGPDDRAKYRQDLRRKLGLEQVEVVRCLGIYKAYKYGPDSVNFLFVGNKELADIATTMLDENDNGINYIEGGEFAAWWDSKTAIAELDDVLLTSEEVVAAVEEIRAE